MEKRPTSGTLELECSALLGAEGNLPPDLDAPSLGRVLQLPKIPKDSGGHALEPCWALKGLLGSTGPLQ